MLIQAADREGRAREGHAKRAFDAFVAANGSGLEVEFATTVGEPETLLASRGRLADLIVVGHAPKAAGLILDMMLWATARPVLVVPQGSTPTLDGPVVVAWTDSAPAARSLRAALPFLDRGVVHVLHVGHGRDGAKVEDAAHYLRLHGVDARAETIEAGARSAGAALLDKAAELRAGLLVSGAYGHSRLRELVLGGTTRDLLQACPLPLLMAH
jgi:nucleotide-binding universal stress UspA family protein